MKPLEALEHWLQGEIVRPHESRSKSRAERDASAALHVKPSRTLSPAQRVEIYSDMYFERLVEILSEEYSAVCSLAGHDDFRRMARAYLREHPSRHWSLNNLGRKLPEFLAGKFRISRKALLHDIARMECAMSIAFDAEIDTVLTSDAVGRLDPADFATQRLVCVSGLSVASYDHAANSIVRAVRQSEDLPSLDRRRTFTVVWRKEWTVWRLDLTEPMYHILAALARGLPISAAIAEGTRRFHGDPAELQAEISRSFGEWITEGMFASVEKE
ncbi:MAG: putative DNA-binding domain-containing protein [Planctomycetes bacterium]|nr:putative DNA-binding domain-containing protein [Planctomycetota bacterium]